MRFEKPDGTVMSQKEMEAMLSGQDPNAGPRGRTQASLTCNVVVLAPNPRRAKEQPEDSIPGSSGKLRFSARFLREPRMARCSRLVLKGLILPRLPTAGDAME